MPFRKVEVGTQPTQLASYNPRRKSITILNYGSVTLFISNDQVDILTKGYPIAPGSGVTLVDFEGDQPELALWGQVESGSTDVRIHEGFGKGKGGESEE